MPTKIQQAETDRLNVRRSQPVPASVVVGTAMSEMISTAPDVSIVRSFLYEGENGGWLTGREKLQIVHCCAGLKGDAEVRAHAEWIKKLLVTVKAEQRLIFLRGQISRLQAQVVDVVHLAKTLEDKTGDKVSEALVSHYLHNPLSSETL